MHHHRRHGFERPRYICGIVLLAAVLLTVGCAGKKTAEFSGFLSDYSLLTANPELEGAITWEDPSADLGKYNKFQVDEVLVHFAPNAEGSSIDPDTIKEISDYMENQLVAALSKNYQVVNAPGPGVLRIRVAITDIKLSKPAWNIHPGSKLAGAGLGGASMEAEAIDTQTGKRVAAIVDSRPARRASFKGYRKLDHPKEVIDFWINRFMKRLDEAHGISK